ncbi:hypothetical protein ACHAXA_007613 [Cyclostephanos tholiformis]|uniref:Uncharacterized protein n=1 Tax=Cyclostephanos tholiformis TaxID=382380 RepID=A0ABD3REM3_9STRA
MESQYWDAQGGGLMIEYPHMREHVMRINGTEDSIMGLSKDLMERLLHELREKLDGVKRIPNAC